MRSNRRSEQLFQSSYDISTSTGISYRNKQLPHTLQIPHNLVRAQLALPEYPIHKADRHLPHTVPHRPRPHHHLHLEHVPLALHARDDRPQDRQTVESEGAREVGDAGREDGRGEEVGAARDELAFEVPAVHAAGLGPWEGRRGFGAVAGTGDDVEIVSLLEAGMGIKLWVREDGREAAHRMNCGMNLGCRYKFKSACAQAQLALNIRDARSPRP